MSVGRNEDLPKGTEAPPHCGYKQFQYTNFFVKNISFTKWNLHFKSNTDYFNTFAYICK